jgi:hypothetical protein
MMHRLFLLRHASQGLSRLVQPLLVTTCLGGSEAMGHTLRSALSRVIHYISEDGEVVDIGGEKDVRMWTVPGRITWR